MHVRLPPSLCIVTGTVTWKTKTLKILKMLVWYCAVNCKEIKNEFRHKVCSKAEEKRYCLKRNHTSLCLQTSDICDLCKW